MGDTDAAWRAWGNNDPYFGVLSGEEFRKDKIEYNKADFFSKGDIYIRNRLLNAERHFNYLPSGRALDFGCGVGRLLIPLSKHFDEVVGIDVSPGMLREAARNLELEGIANVKLIESDDTLSRLDGLFDFVNSYIVLQHIPVRVQTQSAS